jgi:hypothetical protein
LELQQASLVETKFHFVRPLQLSLLELETKLELQVLEEILLNLLDHILVAVLVKMAPVRWHLKI